MRICGEFYRDPAAQATEASISFQLRHLYSIPNLLILWNLLWNWYKIYFVNLLYFAILHKL